ncbi:MAG: hypothetical protein AAF519_04320 [Bacteroidota bacterium]
MKQDIKKPEVKDVTVAIAKNTNEQGEVEWIVYLINNNEVNLENTLVASKGYGEQNGEVQKTSTLRHFLETVEAKTTAQIELIQSDVFHLNNEYWVSYYIDGQIYDKRFTFVPDSISEENLTFIKELNTKGILHS